MKKIGEYTCRGTVNTDDTLDRIILDDGRFDTGYRVTDFKVFIHDTDGTSIRVITAKLMTDDDAQAGINFNADNNEEIGWAVYNFDGNDPRMPHYWSLVDPDNLVVQDLFIQCHEGFTFMLVSKPS